MPSIPDDFPISLRAWPSKDHKESELGSLISRINVERGSFRSVTEEGLEEELRKQEAGESQETIDESDEDAEDEAEEGDRVKELLTARDQMLGQLEQAHYASMFALEFISLLLSKDNPVQASSSISPGLREAVGLGTLGADRLADSRNTQAQKAETAHIVKGWKLQSLNDNADSILASAAKLEKEIEAETKYWQQIVEVDSKSWAVCSLPQEKHTLGVRFGFSESAPNFKNRSIAALRRHQDGSIYLDQGIAERAPKRLRVRVQSNGETTGQAISSTTVPDDSPVLPLILRARNAIFVDELWQELHRESRILANLNVHSTNSTITLPLAPNKNVVIDLLPGPDNSGVEHGVLGHDDDDIAQMLYLSLNLLLSHAHREAYKRRSQPPPPLSNRTHSNPPYALLRPILARIQHQSVIYTLSRSIRPLSRTLAAAALIPTTSAAIFSGFISTAVGTTASLVAASLINNLEASISLPLALPSTSIASARPANITPTAGEISEPEAIAITIRLRTALYPAVDTRYLVTASPSLAEVTPPPQNPAAVNVVLDWVFWAAACAVTGVIRASGGWTGTYNPTVVRREGVDGGRGVEVGISFVPVGEGSGHGVTDVKLLLKRKVVGGWKDGASPEKENRAEDLVWEELDSGVVGYSWSSSIVDSQDEDGSQGQGKKKTLLEVIKEIARVVDAGLEEEIPYEIGEKIRDMST